MAPQTLTPGGFAIVIPSAIYWAPRLSVLPRASLPVTNPPTPWGAPWVRLQDTINGLAATSRAPMDHLYSEERDEIAIIPAATGGRGGGRGGGGGGGGGGAGANAGAGVSLAFEALTFTEPFWHKMNYRTLATAAAQAESFTFTFATACTTNGSLTFSLGNSDGLTKTSFVVSVATSTENSPTAVAIKVAGTTPPTGWTVASSGATVTFTATTTGFHTPSTFSAGGTGVTVGANDPTYVTVGTPGMSGAYVNKSADFSLMIGFEGKLAAGGLVAQEQYVRGFGYRCLNTANGMDVFRRTGADAFLNANLTLECLPEDYTSLTTVQTLNTGYPAALVDPLGKFNLFYAPSGN